MPSDPRSPDSGRPRDPDGPPTSPEQWRFTAEGPQSDAKVRVAALAGRQFGVVAARQLTDLGITASTVRDWRGAGYLFRLLPGVYAVGHVAPSLEADLVASVLWAGPGATLSHATAAWWRGLVDRRPATIEVSTRRRLASRPGVVAYGRRSLTRQWHNGLPVTTVTQILFDLAAGDTPHDRLRRVLAEAEYRDWLDIACVRAELCRGRPGSARLRAVIAEHEPRLARTRSELERRMLALCRRAKLPLPECNATVEGLLVDAVWREQRVVVEVDGRDGHRTWAQTVRDRRRDLTLRAARYTPLRYVWDQLISEAPLVERDLRGALRARDVA